MRDICAPILLNYLSAFPPTESTSVTSTLASPVLNSNAHVNRGAWRYL